MFFPKPNKRFLNQTIYVTGHLYPDVDSVISTIMACQVLKHFGFKVEPLILKYPDQYTIRILNKLNIETPPLRDKSTFVDEKVFLVDHGHISNSIGKETNCEVVGIIDHHISPEVDSLCQNIYIKEKSSCSLILYFMMKEIKDFKITKEHKIMTIYSSAVDTSAMLSDKISMEEKKIINKFIEEEKISIDELKRDILIETDLSLELPILAKNGFITFNEDGIKAGSIYIEVFEHVKKKEEKIKQLLDYLQETTEYQLFVVVYWNFTLSTTTVYLCGDLNTSEIFQTFTLQGISGRGNTVIPMVREKIRTYNKQKN
ncbi:manganese-dependent inorganic pyrophosphatase-related [Anaeramoeba flamelloides]|uniref:Manganese-dependent inorganic pyrophosphatase-related n=1 Tax=Anaeramoeba flamelloides TaxID=1746091 RepID=A0ABQ8Z5F5_9EUKA|nr:manganese-dependent inorganic pyrophosphatase-related [Anaeramoeba flamelloides]